MDPTMEKFLLSLADSIMGCENVRDRANVVEDIANELESHGRVLSAAGCRSMASEWVEQEEGCSLTDD
jgi:CO dehydrogenase/acetyl-CoA synthase alpha subunit